LGRICAEEIGVSRASLVFVAFYTNVTRYPAENYIVVVIVEIL